MILHPAYLLLGVWWVSVNRGNFSAPHTQKPSGTKPAGHTHTHSCRARHLENGKWVKYEVSAGSNKHTPYAKVYAGLNVLFEDAWLHVMAWVQHLVLWVQKLITQGQTMLTYGQGWQMVFAISHADLLRKHWQSSLEPRDSISQIKRSITIVLCPTCWALPCDTGSTKQPEACTPVFPLQHQTLSHVNKASRGNIIFTALARRAVARNWGFMLHKNQKLIQTCFLVNPQTCGSAPWPVTIILTPKQVREIIFYKHEHYKWVKFYFLFPAMSVNIKSWQEVNVAHAVSYSFPTNKHNSDEIVIVI